MRKIMVAALIWWTTPSLSVWGASPAEEVGRLFETAVASQSVPGISVALSDTDGVLWSRGFGFADVENRVAMTAQHKMRVGSVAKVFTTAAMMRLYDRRQIDLDRPVREYVPVWPASHPVITLRQLASHTAGIRHYNPGEFLSNTAYSDISSSLAIFKNDPLLFPPGEGHSYSTYAWTLVAAALEGADGRRRFPEIMQEEVFGPLGMEATRFDNQYSVIPLRPRPYVWRDGRLMNAPQTDHSYKWAGGGFIASTEDVSRFAVAHLSGGYLRAETLNTMFTPARTTDGEPVPFGVGWMIGFDRFKDRYADDLETLAMMAEHTNSVMHSGGSTGSITMMILCRDHGRAVTVVKNVEGDDSADVVKLALQTLDGFLE